MLVNGLRMFWRSIYKHKRDRRETAFSLRSLIFEYLRTRGGVVTGGAIYSNRNARLGCNLAALIAG